VFNINEIINTPPYSMPQDEKTNLYNRLLRLLNDYHYRSCPEYKSILDVLQYDGNNRNNYHEFPFLPVRLFKQYDLLSVNKKRVYKIMNSSGTSGENLSKIYLDKENSDFQRKVLTKIVSDSLGNKRLPMLIIDSNVITGRKVFSARGAGIVGFSIFGKDVTYALNENLELDIEKISNFVDKYGKENFFVFGFTSIIWKYFVEYILNNEINLPKLNGIMIHGGGWKKLAELKVDNTLFKKSILKVCGISNVFNYYGMVEQTGSIFLECSQGYLHTSIFSDIIIRRNDFSICDSNEIGLIQLISLLPTSYPGHNIISEDLGEIIGVDDCKCGKLGKYFIVHGRAEKAEIRGCSDTFE